MAKVDPFTTAETAFNKAQEQQAKLTALSTEHNTVMKTLEAIQKAFQAIKA